MSPAKNGWQSHRDREGLMTQNNEPKGPPSQGDAELGRRLSLIRLRAGFTQNDIAGKVAVSRQHISNIEIGMTSPTIRVLHHYLRACGTDLAEFFYGPLPINQTRRHREYHSKLQALLQSSATSPVVRKVLDSFITSMRPSLTAVPPTDLRAARRALARNKNTEGQLTP